MIKVRGFTWDDMCVDMWHALSGMHAVLNSDVQTRGTVYPLHHSAHTAHCEEEIACFSRGEICDAWDNAARGDEDVPWEDWFDVDEGEGEWCLVKDLELFVNWAVIFPAVNQVPEELQGMSQSELARRLSAPTYLMCWTLEAVLRFKEGEVSVMSIPISPYQIRGNRLN